MDNKLLVIGIDGGTFDLLDPWMENDLLPNLKKIREGGISGTLETVVPPITAPAWTTFYTGKNPGKHGVFDFLLKKENSYEEIPVNASFCKSTTLWDLLGAGNKKMAVLNIPMTYPPQKINGAMICGFLSSAKDRDYTYPPQLLDEIENKFGPYYLLGKTVDVATLHNEKYIEALIDDCRKMSAYKFEVARYLVNKDDYDIVVFHEWGTDRIQHWLWHILDPSHPKHEKRLEEKYRQKIIDYYRFVDEQIGTMIDAAGSGFTVCIMSDHGFCPVERSIDLNVWLLQEGYIAIKKSVSSQLRYALWKSGLTYERLSALFGKLIKWGFKPKAVELREMLSLFRMGRWNPLLSLNDVDWNKTKAYAKTSALGQIIINLKGREPHGIVAPGQEYNLLQGEIVEKLENLYDPRDGRRIKGIVHTREKVYKGPFSTRAPDIFYLPQSDRFQAGNIIGFGSNTPFVSFTGFFASHSMNGIFMIKGKDIKKGAPITDAAITDLAPTILYLMGLKIPDDMDGRVLKEVFTDTFLKNNPIEYYTPSDVKEKITGKPVSKEEDEIKQRLKNLGYF